MVLTLILPIQRQRKHPHKLSGSIVKEQRDFRVSPNPSQTNNYTAQARLLTSPVANAVLSWRSVEGHRSLSRRRIIRGPAGASTPFFTFFADPPSPCRARTIEPRDDRVFLREKRPFWVPAADRQRCQAGFYLGLQGRAPAATRGRIPQTPRRPTRSNQA